MKNIEHFLTSDYANKYNEKKYNIRWLRTETYGKEGELSKQFNKDMIHYDLFRKEISKSLSEQEDNLVEVTRKWIYFLKPRVERLDFWVKLWGAVLTLLVAALGAYSALNGLINKDFSFGIFSFSSLILTFLVGVIVFDIERKKFWYKYVL